MKCSYRRRVRSRGPVNDAYPERNFASANFIIKIGNASFSRFAFQSLKELARGRVKDATIEACLISATVCRHGYNIEIPNRKNYFS